MKFGPRVINSEEISIPSQEHMRGFFSDKLSHEKVESIKNFESSKISHTSKAYPITMKVIDFLRKIKAGVALKVFPSSKIHKFINDKSFVQPEEKIGNIKKLVNVIFKRTSTLIIHPDNALRIAWDILLLLIMIQCFLYIPFQISFDFVTEFDPIINKMTPILFFVDIALNCITGQYVEGLLVLDPKKICLIYGKNLFIYDVIGFTSLFYSMEYRWHNLLHRFLILTKIPSFFVYTKVVLNYFKIELKYRNAVDIVKLLLYSLFLAHNIACLWHLCSKLNPHKNWLISMKIQSEGNFIKYIYSLYWTIVTIMTVGYGDISAQNEYEALFSIFTIIFGSGLYGFILNSIGMILQNNQKKDDHLRNDLTVINSFMERKNIDIKLQRKIQEYLNFLWNEQNPNNHEEEAHIMNRLNHSLREELLLESYGGIFRNYPVFLKNFSEVSLTKLLKTLVEVNLMPGEQIFEEGIVDDCSLYFIMHGSVEIFLSRSETESANSFKTLKKGDIFGEFSFFSGSPRKFSCRSLEFTNVLMINRAAALKIFKETEEDYERFCHIKDKLLLEEDYSIIKLNCLNCQSFKHTIFHCPLLHFVPDLEKVIKRSEFYGEVSRLWIARRVRRRFDFEDVVFAANKVQISDEKKFLTIDEGSNVYPTDSSLEDAEKEAEEKEKKSLRNIENYHEKNKNKNSLGEKKESLKIDTMEEANLETDLDYDEIPNTKKILVSSKSFRSMRSKILQKTGDSEVKYSSGKLGPVINSSIENFQLKLSILTDKVKNFQSYYPENNCFKVIKKIHQTNYRRRENRRALHLNLIGSNFEKEISLKLQKFRHYSFYVGKYRDLIETKASKRSNNVSRKLFDLTPEPHSPSSPKKSKKFLDFSGFFERTKGNTEESCKRLPENYTAKSSSSKKKTRFSASAKNNSKKKITSFKGI